MAIQQLVQRVLSERSSLRRMAASPMFAGLRPLLGGLRYRHLRLADLPVRAHANHSVILDPFKPHDGHELIEIVIQLDATRGELGRYLYSKLYYSTDAATEFSESAVVCFEVPERHRQQRLQIALPEDVWAAARASGHLRLRIDGLPYSKGRWQLIAVKLARADDDVTLARHAKRVAHRQWVREQVRISERHKRVDLAHFPESVSLELTPVCNLRCPHCSSHGMPHLHKHHNRQPEMSIERLQAIGAEVFPHVSVVSAVGRGEPTLVSDELWNCFTGLLREHDVRLSCVTNGTRVRQRFDAGLMPWVHELIFSMDGHKPATFEANRAGAKYQTVVDNLRYYHELRNRLPLSRRPQLTISWTLKRNNVAELPEFARWIAQFEPDLISLRHLVVFQDKERGESLLEHSEAANAALAKAYEELDSRGIRHESPPLMIPQASPQLQPIHFVTSKNQVLPAPPAARAERHHIELQTAEREPECNWMHRTAIIMADGEVITCGKHYGEQVGHLNEETSLWDIWNGPRMQSLRDGYGKPHMWDQCKDCWLRELKWHSQREAKDLSRPYSLADGMDYTTASWDYRRYSEL
ncbi:MAG: radical SAM protein [Rhizobacter sp.]